MADAALLHPRRERPRWAAPHSAHDKIIATLRIVLPIGIGVLTAFLVMAPLSHNAEVSFVLDKNRVAVAHERMKIQSATYRGADQQGRAFALNAGSGVQRTSQDRVVQLQQLNAELQTDTGPARIVADRGLYNMDNQQVTVGSPVRFTAPDGYRLDASQATIDLETRRMQSGGSVTGTVPQGNFSASSMSADLENRSIRLDGNARLRIVPGRAR